MYQHQARRVAILWLTTSDFNVNVVHPECVNQSDVQRGTNLDAYLKPYEHITLIIVENENIVRARYEKLPKSTI